MLVYDSETKNKFPAFIALTRLNRPIGIYLLLWPTLLALWFAADGFPPVTTLLILFSAPYLPDPPVVQSMIMPIVTLTVMSLEPGIVLWRPEPYARPTHYGPLAY